MRQVEKQSACSGQLGGKDEWSYWGQREQHSWTLAGSRDLMYLEGTGYNWKVRSETWGWQDDNDQSLSWGFTNFSACELHRDLVKMQILSIREGMENWGSRSLDNLIGSKAISSGCNGSISLKSDIIKIAFSQEPYSRVWRTEWRESVAAVKYRSGKKFSASERNKVQGRKEQ